MPASSRAKRNPPDYGGGLPASPDAERMLLACILKEQLAFDVLRQDLAAWDFTDPKNRKLYERMDDLWVRGRSIDRVTLTEELIRHKELRDGLGGYVSELDADLPQVAHPEGYVAIVREKAARRRILHGVDALAKRALLETEPVEEVVASGAEFFADLQSAGGRVLSPSLPQWPAPLSEDAYHGVAGEIVRLIEPHSEADPVALLMQFLVAFGSLIGRGPYMLAEADRHHTNEYIVLVGVSSVGRKGSAWGRIRAILESLVPDWLETRLLFGIGSGESLIDKAAEPDHRVLIQEGEFARLLSIVNREGSTISSNIRLAWDQGLLEINSRQKTAKARGAHVSLIGHITKDELAKKLSDVELANGFGNRILWACVKRCKSLPHGGGITGDATPILKQLNEAVRHARQLGDTRLSWDSEAHDLWGEKYEDLAEGQPGLLGSATSRAAPHVLRLSLIYALLDCADAVSAKHLRAALEIWRYCYDSARFIWGAALGDPTADSILAALRENRDGLTRWDISNHFGRNKPATEIDRAINVLTERGMIQSSMEETGGRSSTRYRIA